MDKNEFTKKLQRWLITFLTRKFSDNYEIVDIIIPDVYLSKLNNELIKSLPNYSIWDFKPDILGILKNKETKEINLVFVNRSTSALSLKEIGELQCYARLANTKLALLVSLSGISNEVNILLLENDIRKRLLNYGDDKDIIVFSWDIQIDGVDFNSVMPLEKRDYLTK